MIWRWGPYIHACVNLYLICAFGLFQYAETKPGTYIYKFWLLFSKSTSIIRFDTKLWNVNANLKTFGLNLFRFFPNLLTILVSGFVCTAMKHILWHICPTNHWKCIRRYSTSLHFAMNKKLQYYLMTWTSFDILGASAFIYFMVILEFPWRLMEHQVIWPFLMERRLPWKIGRLHSSVP